jgi:hypothetical protein
MFRLENRGLALFKQRQRSMDRFSGPHNIISILRIIELFNRRLTDVAGIGAHSMYLNNYQ